MNSFKEGYLYIATGENFINEALRSASSLKKVDKNAHITLITNKEIENDLFEQIIIKSFHKNNWKEGLLYKVKNIYASPYQKTFFIDTDTYFCDNCRELFKLLDYYDLLLSQAPCSDAMVKINEKFLKGYFSYNTGVILFKKNQQNSLFFENWLKIFEKKLGLYHQDQPAFMEALLTSKSRVYTLQVIYNARTIFFLSLPYLKVKIIHGRHENYEKIIKKINLNAKNRAWNPIKQNILYKKLTITNLIGKHLGKLFKKIKKKFISNSTSKFRYYIKQITIFRKITQSNQYRKYFLK